jgi:hypothetical protein
LVQHDYKPGNALEQSRHCLAILQSTIDSTLSQYGRTQDYSETYVALTTHQSASTNRVPLDSALAAIAFGDKARVYAQVGAGEILEYQFDETKWTEGPVIAKAKEDTPLAVATKGTDYVRELQRLPFGRQETNQAQICVYYLDEDNIIREVSGSKTWKEGTLSQLNYKVHPQSKLAAGWYDELVRIYAQAEDGSLLEFSACPSRLT